MEEWDQARYKWKSTNYYNTNQTVNIYLSSAYSDMSSERKMIQEELVPELNEFLKSINVKINIIDLRYRHIFY